MKTKLAVWLRKWSEALGMASWIEKHPVNTILRFDCDLSKQQAQDIDDYMRGRKFMSKYPDRSTKDRKAMQ